jgi:hypothetical protein
VVAGLLGASLLPIANWFPSERSAPWYPDALSRWLLGTLVVVGGGWLLARGSIAAPVLWREGALARWLDRVDPAKPVALGVVAAVAALLYLVVAVVIFETRPIHIDEVVLRFQARTYAAGRLWWPVDPDPAFRSVLHLAEHQGRWFGHFPPGWPLLLALGELARAPWVVGPLAGGAAVWAWGLVLRRAEPRVSVRGGALLLFGLAPFVVFVAGSSLNHQATLMWLLLALAGWLRLVERPSLATAVATGLAVGMAAITRPPDAAAFGLPAAVWLLFWWQREGRRVAGPVAALIAGALILVLGMLAVNAATTGSALTSGYQLLWGPHVGLGFHPAPYGPDHTVPRGLELLSLYLLRLNLSLFEAPIPSLLPAGIALLLAGRSSALDRYLLAASGALLLCYFAYWHDGFFLGPRFIYPLVPVVALWTARLPEALRRFGEVPRRAGAFGLALAVVGAVTIGVPERAGRHAALQPAMRFDPDRAAREAGVEEALVVVRETWGAQLLARLWALGVSRPAAERYYRGIDSCRLEHAVLEAERGGADGGGGGGQAGGQAVAIQLDRLLADSSRLIASPFSPDTSERYLPGTSYDDRCRARITEDLAGTALLAPTLLSRRSDLRFVRDLHERNRKLLLEDPAKPVYLLARGPRDAAPTFRPLNRDSLLGGVHR